jgi:hypothetical protein
MKKIVLLLVVAFPLLFSCKKGNNDLAVKNTDTLCFIKDSVHFCPDKGNDFCSQLPPDVYLITSPTGTFSNGYSSVLSPKFQPSFDIFSWQSFIALNWPANSKGDPIGGLNDNSDSLRVWEYYTDVAKVFTQGDQLLYQNLTKAKNERKKFFYMTSKSPDGLPEFDTKEADGHPLIDRNLNFAVFEEKINPIESNFITSNNLITKKGINDYYTSHNNTFQLPVDSGDTVGSIEIKASWRVLDTAQGDDPSRYYSQEAIIYIPAENSVNGQPFTINCTVGLVGIHILRKTSTFTNWIWSTFEHIDNTPDNPQQAQDEQSQWSFYNPACLTCPTNQPPIHQEGDTLTNGEVVYKFSNVAPYAERYAISVAGEASGRKFGTQVTRVYPIYSCTEQMNKIWQAKLAAMGSVWANYRLVGTQWMVPADEPPFTKINAPFYLGNTTAETYIQDSASCISCHGDFAEVSYEGNTIKTDFSFIFLKAK